MFYQNYNLIECAEADYPTLQDIADQLRSHPQEFWDDFERGRVASHLEGMAQRQARALCKERKEEI